MSSFAIWKYELEITDVQALDMPRGARILTVQVQRGILCLWAVVDRMAETEVRRIHIVGTGHYRPSKDFRRYIGTVQMASGDLIWHVFEEDA